MPPATVAVNEAGDPAQSGFVPPVCEIDTVGFPCALIVIEIEFEVAVDDVVQSALEVSTQLTICPFVRVVLE